MLVMVTLICRWVNPDSSMPVDRRQTHYCSRFKSSSSFKSELTVTAASANMPSNNEPTAAPEQMLTDILLNVVLRVMSSSSYN